MVESWRAVGHDRPDVLFDEADGMALLDPARLAAAAARIAPGRAAAADVTAGGGTVGPSVARIGDGDTTHLCAIDGDGLGVSLTQSNALDFGSHLVEPTTGIFLHNRGVGFSLLAGHPAEVGPGRRPPHTLSPMLVTSAEGSLSHLVGAMGGDAQPQILVQLLARMLRAGQDPAAADRRPPHVARRTGGRSVPALVGRRPDRAGRSRRPGGLDGGPARARAPGPGHPGLRPHRRRLRADHCADLGGRTSHFVGASDPRSPEGAAVGR